MIEKSAAQKMNFKAGMKVMLINPPAGYTDLAGPIPDGVEIVGDMGTDRVDAVHLFARSREELELYLPRAKDAVKPDGMIWVSYYKGTSKQKTDIHRDTINAYGHTMGMEGIFMISIDEDWSALRFKITG